MGRRFDYHDLRQRVLGKGSSQQENVIPMINVIFLLLLYFMIAGNLQPDYDVSPPQSTTDAEPPKQTATVSVNKDGSIRFEGQPVSFEELQVRFSEIVGHDHVKIHADGKLSALAISKIMKSASEAGIVQFSLVTQRKVADR